MLKKLTMVIVIAFISIIMAGGAIYYILLEGTVSPEPTFTGDRPLEINISEIEDGKDSINIEDRELNQDRQKLMLAEQQENLEKIKYEINKNIETALLNINEVYQEKINKKENILAEKLDYFIEEKEQEIKERLMAKKNIYQKKTEEISSEIKENKLKELALYQSELDKKYYNDILNYNLKLRVLDLTEKEEEKYIQELVKIEKEKERLALEKKNELEEQIKKDISDLENDYNEKFTLFKEDLNDTINRQIREKEVAIRRDLMDYVSTQQDFMKEEMEKKREELIARGSKELEYQQIIVQNLRKEYERMQNG